MFEEYKIGENLQIFIDEGCQIKVNTEHVFGKDYECAKESNTLLLINNAGKTLLTTSANNLQKGLDQLDKKLIEKATEKQREKKPLEKLKFEVDQLRELNFKNSNAHRLSRLATFNGWDLRERGNGNIEIKVHNAANVVLWFDPLQEHRVINLNLINLQTTVLTNENKNFIKLLDLISDYLRAPLEIRKQERERE